MKRTKKLSQPAHHAEDLVKAIRTHQAVLSVALCRFAKKDPKRVEDATKKFIDVLVECLEDSTQRAEDKEQSLIQERANDIKPRLTRDADQTALYNACVKVKQRLTNFLGDEESRVYGVEGVTPRHGVSLLDHASDVVTLLEKFSIVREDEMLGTLDTSVLANYLKKLCAAFNASLGEVSSEEQKLVGALNTRDTELNSLTLLTQSTHTISSVLAHLSERDDLRTAFRRLKPSVGTTSGEENSETDANENTTSTEKPADAQSPASPPTPLPTSAT